MARTPKLDAVLAAQVESARAALAEVVPEDQIGDHLAATAEGERLVMHRFEARVPGYGGWQWFVTLARGPRMKVPTVCDSGLLPGDGALLAPDWVPWADRVAPEELEAERLAVEAAAAAEGSPEADGAGPVQQQTASDGDAAPADAAEPGGPGTSTASEAPRPDDVDAAGTASSGPEATQDAGDGADDDADSEQPRRPRRRRRARRATRG